MQQVKLMNFMIINTFCRRNMLKIFIINTLKIATDNSTPSNFMLNLGFTFSLYLWSIISVINLINASFLYITK